MAAIAAVAARCEDGGKGAVFVKAEKQSEHDGQSTAAKHVGTENTVFRAEDKQCDENPKG